MKEFLFGVIALVLVACGSRPDGPLSPLPEELGEQCGGAPVRCSIGGVGKDKAVEESPDSGIYTAELQSCERGSLDQVWQNLHRPEFFHWAESEINSGPHERALNDDHTRWNIGYEATKWLWTVYWDMEFDLKKHVRSSGSTEPSTIIGWYKKTTEPNEIRLWDGCFQVDADDSGWLSLRVQNRISGKTIREQRSRNAAWHILKRMMNMP